MLKIEFQITIQITDDNNYLYYSQNLRKILKLPAESGFDGIIESNNNIDISSKEEQDNIQEFKHNSNYSNDDILPLNYHQKKIKIMFDTMTKIEIH